MLTKYSKFQLAIQYAHSIRDAAPYVYVYVFWVHVSTQARFEEAYRDIADRRELWEEQLIGEDKATGQ
jgi:hypothetical protein